MADIPKLGLRDAPGASVGSQTVARIDCNSEAELNEVLSNIFAGSMWDVSAEKAEEGRYTYYFRSKNSDTRPVTLITGELPLLLKSGIAFEQDILLIPLPVDPLTKAVYDGENRQVLFEDHSLNEGVKCELPGYFAVGVKGNVDDRDFEGASFNAMPITGAEYHKCEAEPMPKKKYEFLCSPFSLLVDSRCLALPKELKETTETTVDTAAAKPLQYAGWLFFDLSGSVEPADYFEKFRKDIARYIYIYANIAEDDHVEAKCGRVVTKECRQATFEALKRENVQVLIAMGYYIGYEFIQDTIQLPLCEVTGCGELVNFYDLMARGFFDPIISGIEEKAKGLKTSSGRSAPSGPDLPTNLSSGALQVSFYQTPYGQDICGRLFEEVCYLGSTKIAPTCVPIAERERAVKWSVAEGLPLFLSISLFPSEGPEQENGAALESLFDNASSDAEIEEAIRGLYRLPMAERSADMYTRLTRLCRNTGRDRRVSGAAAALLGAWAMKGDAAARSDILWFFGRSETLASEEARTVVSRVAANFLSDDEAKAILERIKAEPDSGDNSVLLSALAGRAEFVEAFGVMLSSYHSELYEPGKRSAVVEALGRVFIDPITQTDDLELCLSADERKMISGNNWSADILQQVYEKIVLAQDLSISEVDGALDPLLLMISRYVQNSIDRQMVEKSSLAVNTRLDERHVYPQIALEKMIEQGVELARSGGREESFISIEKKNPTAKGELAAIEVGILETEAAVNVPYLSAAELKRFFSAAGVGADENFKVTKWHIHPRGSVNAHEMIYNIPSSADLISYIYFAEKWRKIAPKADFEFRIFTPSGVLVLRPQENFFQSLSDPREYVDWMRWVYLQYVYGAGLQVSTKRLDHILSVAGYFKATFEER